MQSSKFVLPVKKMVTGRKKVMVGWRCGGANEDEVGSGEGKGWEESEG